MDLGGLEAGIHLRLHDDEVAVAPELAEEAAQVGERDVGGHEGLQGDANIRGMSRPEPGASPLRRLPLEDDHFHDQCGLFGIFGHPEAAHLAYMGLYALQHRGQESAGIAASDGKRIRLEKGMGLVNDVFTEERLDSLAGDRAIGHVRYSTSGDTVASNAQPYLIECHRGPIAIGHNGNLVNATILRHELEAAGSIFQSTSDTEVILHL